MTDTELLECRIKFAENGYVTLNAYSETFSVLYTKHNATT